MLAAVVTVAIALYTGGWFYAADRLKSTLRTALDGGGSGRLSAECADMDVRGYPFRIGLFCSGVRIDDHRNGISGSFGALRSAAQVYAPGHIVWELDEPAVIRAAPGLTLSAQWATLQSSLRTTLDGLQETSLRAEDLKASLMSSRSGGTITLNAKHTELHLRENGVDLDGALLIETANAVIEGMAQPLPTLSTSADLTLAGKAGLLKGRDEAGTGLRGTQGELRRLVADLGEGRVLTLTGPFAFDADGYLTSELTLEVENINGWRDALKATLPAAAKTIDSAGNMLTALVSGGSKVSVKLSIVKGDVFVSGFIRVGEIPPI